MTANGAPAQHIAHGIELKVLQDIFSDNETGGSGIVLLAGITGGDGTVSHDRAELGEFFHVDIGSYAFIPVEHDIDAAALRHGDGDNLVGKDTIFPGGCGAFLAAHAIFVGFFAGNLIFGGEVFGGLDHAGDFAKPVDGL